MLRIKIKGKEYPCEMVMGALLQFKRETGKEVSEVREDDLEGLLTLMWLCLKCTCKGEGVEFGMDFEIFCNSVSLQTLTAWNQAVSDEQKKTLAPTTETAKP